MGTRAKPPAWRGSPWGWWRGSPAWGGRRPAAPDLHQSLSHSCPYQYWLLLHERNCTCRLLGCVAYQGLATTICKCSLNCSQPILKSIPPPPPIYCTCTLTSGKASYIGRLGSADHIPYRLPFDNVLVSFTRQNFKKNRLQLDLFSNGTKSSSKIAPLSQIFQTCSCY